MTARYLVCRAGWHVFAVQAWLYSGNTTITGEKGYSEDGRGWKGKGAGRQNVTTRHDTKG